MDLSDLPVVSHLVSRILHYTMSKRDFTSKRYRDDRDADLVKRTVSETVSEMLKAHNRQGYENRRKRKEQNPAKQGGQDVRKVLLRKSRDRSPKRPSSPPKKKSRTDEKVAATHERIMYLESCLADTRTELETVKDDLSVEKEKSADLERKLNDANGRLGEWDDWIRLRPLWLSLLVFRWPECADSRVSSHVSKCHSYHFLNDCLLTMKCDEI